MAKATKTAAKPAEKAAKPKVEMKFGIEDLADKLGIEAASARIKLRNAGVDKVEGRYGWNTKDELDKVAKSLSEKKAPAKTEAKAPAKGKTDAKGKAAANDGKKAPAKKAA